MKKLSLFCLLLFLAVGCSFPYEYRLIEEFFKASAQYKDTKHPGYIVFTVETQQGVVGYLLKIPGKSGTFYLKVSPTGTLDRAFFVIYKKEKGQEKEVDKRLPIFQNDWGNPLSSLQERSSVGPACRHFYETYITKKLQQKRRSIMADQ